MIVVTTPTGQIGSQLVHLLLAAGETVRVIAREPAKLSPELREVEMVQGSADDPAVLNKAFATAEAVFWLLPPPFNARDVNEYCLGFTGPAAAAIAAQGVKRVVAVSSLGRDLGRDAGFVSLLHLMDEIIESTGVDYRALWCPGFMENMFMQIESIKQRGMFFLPVQADVKMPLAATRDIAATAARLLLDKSWTGQGGIAVMGPEDLSLDDMADILSDVLGKPIRFQQIPGDAYKAQLIKSGASEAAARGLVEMYAAIGDGLYGSLPRTPANTTPTSFRQWSEEEFKPAVRR